MSCKLRAHWLADLRDRFDIAVLAVFSNTCNTDNEKRTLVKGLIVIIKDCANIFQGLALVCSTVLCPRELVKGV